MLDKLDGLENCDKTLLVGRILLVAVFFLGALNWVLSGGPSDGLIAGIAGKGIPAAALVGWIALVLKLGGSILVLLGFKTRVGCLMLVVFTLVTAFGWHTPSGWPIDGTFLKELSMIGGILILMTTGPGKYSLDAKNNGS